MLVFALLTLLIGREIRPQIDAKIKAILRNISYMIRIVDETGLVSALTLGIMG